MILDLLRSKTAGARVLEVGCGEGKFIVFAHRHGMEIEGYDIAEHAGLDGGRAARVVSRLRGNGIEPERVRWASTHEGIPFPSGAFDAVISIQVLEHVADLPRLFAEIARVLKPDGVALHYFPTKRILIDPHSGVPFVHRVTTFRRIWLRASFFVGKYWSYRIKRSYSLGQFVREFDWYLSHLCHFRTMQEMAAASRAHGLDFQFYSLHLCGVPPSWLQYFTSIILIQARSRVPALQAAA